MAKVDSIIRQIRNAQAAAIAKNGGIAAGRYANVEKDTEEIIKKQIDAQQTAKKESSGQAARPAKQQVTDTETTRQIENAMNETVAALSPQVKPTMGMVQTGTPYTPQSAAPAPVVNGPSTSPTQFYVETEEMRSKREEEAAKATAEAIEARRKLQEQQAADRAIMERDLAELEKWPEADRRALETYATTRAGSLDSFADAMAGAVTGSNVGTRSAKAYEIFTQLSEKYGSEQVKNLAETWTRAQNEEFTKSVQEDAAGAVAGKPWAATGHSAATIPANLVGAISSPLGVLSDAATRTGRYSTLDPNNAGNILNVYSGAVRGQVAQDIAGDEYDEDGNKVKDGGLIRQGLSYAYQGLMSAADSIARVATVGGTGSLALAATSSFGQTVSEASRQGATPAQAVILATGSAALEVATEKIPLDEMLSAAKGGIKSAKEIALEALKQAGIEATTEEISLFGGILLEAAVLQEKSSYRQQIGEAIANGASYEDAKAQADLAVYNEAMETAAVSGLSGFISGDASAIFGNFAAKSDPNATVEATQKNPAEAAPAAHAATNADNAQTEPQQAHSTLDAVLAKVKSSDTGASNAMADAVLNDSDAMKRLMQQTLEDISGTKSERRKAVKNALNQLAGHEQTKGFLEDTGAELAKNAPMPEPKTQQQIAADRTAAAMLGMEAQESVAEPAGVGMVADLNGKQNGQIVPGNSGTRVFNVDNDQVQTYNNSNGTQGGMNDAGTQYQNGQQNDGAGSTGNTAAGLAGVQQSNGTDNQRWWQSSGLAGDTGVLRVSDKLQEAQRKRGTQTYPVLDTTGNPDSYEKALIAGRNSDQKNGWCVTQKSAQELRDGNVRTFMNESGTVGVGVAPDGDIVAVFKNRNGGPRKALDTLMPIAIEQGGDRLDCYGEGLVKVYASYGFTPVARVEFNPEYANDGWTPEKGTPYIYMMMHNGDSADKVVSNMGRYDIPSQEQLNALPTYGKDDYDSAMAYRDSLMNQKRTQQADTQNVYTDGGQQGIRGTGAAETPGGQRDLTEQNTGTVGAMQSQFKHEVKQSKVYGNTYQNTTYADIHDIGRDAKKADPNIDQYDVITEAESVHEADLRTETGRDRLAEHRALMEKDGWTAADNDTAMRLLTVYRREGKKDRFLELSRKQRQMGTQAGQMVQSFAKYSREDATVAVQDAIADLDELTIDQVDRKFWNPEQKQKGSQGKKDAFQTWKESITGSLLEVANDIENVEDGDKASMKDVVRQIANLRHTTAWAGYSSDLSRRTERGLNKMDFDTLKTVAKTQLSMIPNDFRRRGIGEILKQIRAQNMLFTITTKFKNDSGNITNGIMDAVSDSFSGRMIDAIIGKWTGKRTVGNDLKFAREYSKAARDAGDVAAAFVSLDIPMETDAKYSSGRTRTWTPNTSNMFGRLMSAYEKHMKYALEVSDKFYEGGAAHVVSRSLESLGEKSGLTPEQIRDIAQKTGERRTFKDPGASVGKSGKPKNGRMLARANVGLKNALNNIGTENFGLGDMVMPFAAVSAEVKQVGMDYTGGGLISGMKEIISIAKDVRNGKEIDPYRQRTAATNFGRGMTGVGMIAAFTALAATGAIKVHNDRDSEERMMNQAQGLSGAQWNLNASLRWLEATMSGATPEEAAKAAKWQSGDELITIDFLEPYNTQMHIGYLLSQGEDIPTAIMKGNFDSLLEMPMMQTLSDLADLQQAFTEVSDGDMDGVRDAAGQLVGTVAGSIVPNWMRKTAQVIDPYYRDTYDTNPFGKAAKEVIASIPVLSAALPKKYDNLGKEQRRFDESEWMAATIDNLVTPWDTDTYQTNPVYQEIERLNDIDGINVTPPKAKRKITYTDNTGKEHEKYNLSPEQYETMQRIQGQTAAKLLADIITSAEYKALTDDQKAATISAVYEYAQEQGKKAAIDDYYSNAASWVQNSTGGVNDFISRGALSPLQRAVESTVNALSSGWEVTDAAISAMDESYESYSSMSHRAKQAILDNAVGDTLKYLQVRSQGVSTKEYLEAKEHIAELTPEEGNKSVSDAQKAEAIAGIRGMSEAHRTSLVKMEVSDAQGENIDQIKELGYSVADYAKLYRDYKDYTSGNGKKDRTIKKWMQDYGISYSAAKSLYEVFS